MSVLRMGSLVYRLAAGLLFLIWMVFIFALQSDFGLSKSNIAPPKDNGEQVTTFAPDNIRDPSTGRPDRHDPDPYAIVRDDVAVDDTPMTGGDWGG